jgi:hypothetical protein
MQEKQDILIIKRRNSIEIHLAKSRCSIYLSVPSNLNCVLSCVMHFYFEDGGFD